MKRLGLLLAVVLFGVALSAPTTQPEKEGDRARDQPEIKPGRIIELNEGPLRSVAFSVDGRTVAAAGDCVHLFDVKSGGRLALLRGHTAEVNAIVFAPDGATLASGSSDRSVRLWHVQSGKLLKILEQKDSPVMSVPVKSLAYYPGGKTLASTADHYVTLWDLDKGSWEHQVRTTHLPGCVCVVIAPDGKHCAVGGPPNRREFNGQLSMYRPNFGLQLIWNRAHEGEGIVTHVAFSADSKKLLSCGQDNTVRVWDVQTGQLLQKLFGPDGSKVMQSALFTRDGERIVAVSREGTLRLWARDGKLLASVKASDKVVLGLTISPDGMTLATCGEDQAIHLWHLSPKYNDKKP